MSSIITRLPSVKDIIKIYNLRAKAQLSQNFLLDKNITDKIIRKANLSLRDSLSVEVGPGPGLLTRSLLEAGAPNVVAIEKDERFLPSLKQLSEAVDSKLKVIHGDMLKTDSQTIWDTARVIKESVKSVHIVGNLPFSVATPLLIQWLRMVYSRSGLLSQDNGSLTLMFQKEVAERIVASPGTKRRGRLSVMAQAVCQTRLIYNVPSTAFVPEPKVNASVIQLKPLSGFLLEAPIKLLEEIVRIFFLKRRKTLRRIASDHSPELLRLITDLGFDLSSRPEDLSTDQFCELANIVFSKHTELFSNSNGSGDLKEL